MKYILYINQYAAVKNDFGLDFIDLIIFDTMRAFSQCDSCKKVQTKDGTYFWMSHEKIREELPLLGIKSNQGIINRIDKIVSAGLLVKSSESVSFGKSLYKIGPMYEQYEFNNNQQNLTSLNETLDPPQQNLRVPLNETLGNNNTIYNNNNYNKTLNDKAHTHEEFFEELTSNTSYIELAAKQNGITREKVLTYISQYRDHLTLGATVHTDRQDFLRHFRDWLRIKVQQDGKTRPDIQDRRRSADVDASSWKDYESGFLDSYDR